MSDFPKQIQDRIDAGMKCGSGISKGWMPLVDELDNALAELHPDYVIDQIKEKFGSLRYYVSGVDSSEAHLLINEAECKSQEICEECGAPGERRSDRWIRTLCDECSK